MARTEIGVIDAIARYPVKSMGAEPLLSAELMWVGLHGDRQYAFVRSGNRSRFPWLTARDVSDLVLHKARYGDPDDPRNAPARVTTPDGQDYAIDDPALAERLSSAAGESVSLIQVGRGCFDAMPVSVVSTTTLAALETARGGAVGLERFRINLVIRAAPAAGRETNWLGGTLTFGASPSAARVLLGWAIPRCAMVTVDPATAERDPSVLRLVARDFANEVGAYGSVAMTGTIQVGDRVWLDSPG